MGQLRVGQQLLTASGTVKSGTASGTVKSGTATWTE